MGQGIAAEYIKRNNVDVSSIKTIGTEFLGHLWAQYDDRTVLTRKEAVKCIRRLARDLGIPFDSVIADKLVKSLDSGHKNSIPYNDFKNLFMGAAKAMQLPLTRSMRNLGNLMLDSSITKVTVRLNVYDLFDLTKVNNYAVRLGFGAFHSAIEFLGTEVSFGYPDGIYQILPRASSIGRFRTSLVMGECVITRSEKRDLLHELGKKWPGESYHWLTNNCNHFCEALCMSLVRHKIPKSINRLAKFVKRFKGFIPEEKVGEIKTQEKEESSPEDVIQRDVVSYIQEPENSPAKKKKKEALEEWLETLERMERGNKDGVLLLFKTDSLPSEPSVSTRKPHVPNRARFDAVSRLDRKKSVGLKKELSVVLRAPALSKRDFDRCLVADYESETSNVSPNNISGGRDELPPPDKTREEEVVKKDGGAIGNDEPSLEKVAINKFYRGRSGTQDNNVNGAPVCKVVKVKLPNDSYHSVFVSVNDKVYSLLHTVCIKRNMNPYRYCLTLNQHEISISSTLNLSQLKPTDELRIVTRVASSTPEEVLPEILLHEKLEEKGLVLVRVQLPEDLTHTLLISPSTLAFKVLEMVCEKRNFNVDCYQLCFNLYPLNSSCNYTIQDVIDGVLSIEKIANESSVKSNDVTKKNPPNSNSNSVFKTASPHREVVPINPFKDIPEPKIVFGLNRKSGASEVPQDQNGNVGMAKPNFVGDMAVNEKVVSTVKEGDHEHYETSDEESDLTPLRVEHGIVVTNVTPNILHTSWRSQNRNVDTRDVTRLRRSYSNDELSTVEWSVMSMEVATPYDDKVVASNSNRVIEHTKRTEKEKVRPVVAIGRDRTNGPFSRSNPPRLSFASTTAVVSERVITTMKTTAPTINTDDVSSNASTNATPYPSSTTITTGTETIETADLSTYNENYPPVNYKVRDNDAFVRSEIATELYETRTTTVKTAGLTTTDTFYSVSSVTESLPDNSNCVLQQKTTLSSDGVLLMDNVKPEISNTADEFLRKQEKKIESISSNPKHIKPQNISFDSDKNVSLTNVPNLPRLPPLPPLPQNPNPASTTAAVLNTVADTPVIPVSRSNNSINSQSQSSSTTEAEHTNDQAVTSPYTTSNIPPRSSGDPLPSAADDEICSSVNTMLGNSYELGVTLVTSQSSDEKLMISEPSSIEATDVSFVNDIPDNNEPDESGVGGATTSERERWRNYKMGINPSSSNDENPLHRQAWMRRRSRSRSGSRSLPLGATRNSTAEASNNQRKDNVDEGSPGIDNSDAIGGRSVSSIAGVSRVEDGQPRNGGNIYLRGRDVGNRNKMVKKLGERERRNRFLGNRGSSGAGAGVGFAIGSETLSRSLGGIRSDDSVSSDDSSLSRSSGGEKFRRSKEIVVPESLGSRYGAVGTLSRRKARRNGLMLAELWGKEKDSEKNP